MEKSKNNKDKKNKNKNKNRRKSKKAQEEMVGFVVIVLLVIVIGVVFLGFSMRQKPTAVEHQESMMLDIMYSLLAYSCCDGNARDLIKDCYSDPSKECDGKPVCDYVEELFIDVLDKTDSIADASVHGYVMNISAGKELIYSEKGNITGNYFGATVPIPVYSDEILFKLRFYYSK